MVAVPNFMEQLTQWPFVNTLFCLLLEGTKVNVHSFNIRHIVQFTKLEDLTLHAVLNARKKI